MTYAPGDRVRVSARGHQGHHRTPGYLKGRTGRVERVRGSFTDPETSAYGGDGRPERRLYLVGFAQTELWPGYPGAATDRLLADVFEHWLEPA
ncbi:MAG TPA: SH3-like domain-containing protein [Thermoleophilia bacterium]|nr:SH3-like domain-containing protein [Thermoleophilia bacterium]